MLKKFSIIGLTLILGTTPILASVFPNTIWKPLDEYTLSKSENNLENQIAASEKVISIMTPEPESQERINILLNHHLELANAYNTIGNYEKAYENFKLYIPFGESQGHDVSYAYAKLMTLQPSLEVFQLNSNASAPYFDAKFEPTQGVIYGSYYDKDTYIGVAYNNEDIRSRYPSEESMLLVYLEFGQDIKTPYIQNMLNLAKEEDKLVFLAWNTAGSTLDTANSSQFPLHQTPQEYIASTIDYLSSQGLDALIRFGGEMNNGPSGRNVFTGEVDSAGFIESFQYVSNIAKQHDNIGMVWSPDDIGGLDTPFEMFYPGDEYVDWVGVSMYPKKYFRDEIDTSNNKDINALKNILGIRAQGFVDNANGLGSTEIHKSSTYKSQSISETFMYDTDDYDEIRLKIKELSDDLYHRLSNS
ncbi:MAG: hypothetical protein ATN32_05910 [Candidatus Epulonipiscium fishelsonii]|nr:MAG: hypothetical protein ATN32_05910 [Epulopiscium sp. AS2M-Bin002]